MNEQNKKPEPKSRIDAVERYRYHIDGEKKEIHANSCTCQRCFNLVLGASPQIIKEASTKQVDTNTSDSVKLDDSTTRLEFLADSFEDVEAELEARKAKTVQDYQVCLCGHSSRTHHYMAELDRHFCDFAKSGCPCSKFQPAFLVQNLTFFMFKTSGIGTKHALTLGLHRHAKAGYTATPIFEGICVRCQDSEKQIKFVAITKSGKISNNPEAINTYLCMECILKIGGPGV